MTAILNKVATKVFGSANERLLKRLWPIVSDINALEPEMKLLSDDELRERTVTFREQVEKRIAAAELTGDQSAHLLREDPLSAQFQDPGQEGSMRAASQEDCAVLQQCPALATLGTADHLGVFNEHITRSQMQEAERARKGLVGGRDVWLGRHAQLSQRRRHDAMHARRPPFPGLPRWTGREPKRVSHLMLMQQRRSARRNLTCHYLPYLFNST